MPIYTSTSIKKKRQKEKKEKAVVDKSKKIKINFNFWAFSLIAFSILFLLVVFPFLNIFRDFFTGILGLFVYPFFACGILISIAMLNKRKYVIHKKYILLMSLNLLFVLCILHLVLTSKFSLDTYGEYLALCYKSGKTAGGLILGLAVYPFAKFLTVVGAYLIFSIGLSISISFSIEYIVRQKYMPQDTRFADFVPVRDIDKNDVAITLDAVMQKNSSEIAKAKLGLSEQKNIISSNMPNPLGTKPSSSRPMTKQEYILTPIEPSVSPFSRPKAEDIFVRSSEEKIDSFSSIKEKYKSDKLETTDTEKPNYSLYTIQGRKQAFENRNKFGNRQDDFKTVNGQNINNLNSQNINNIKTDFEDDEDADIFEDSNILENDSDIDISYEDENKNNQSQPDKYNSINSSDFYKNISGTNFAGNEKPDRVITDFKHTTGSNIGRDKGEQINNFGAVNAIQQKITQYIKPPISLLWDLEVEDEVDSEVVQQNIEILEKTLEDFKVPAKVIAVQRGPAVTRYELSMPSGISVKKVQMHADDIAMVLASNGAVRIEAPIPGKSAVGIEVPNDKVTPVSLKEVFSTNEFLMRPSPLSFALGKDINGDIQFCNLDKLAHIIVAGSTGSGKSVCLNAMILNMIYKSSPSDLRLILIDPKRVEFATYEGLPHLLIKKIITEKDQAINALDWAISEMERRYIMLQKHHVVNIKDYNNLESVKNGQYEKVPAIAIIIDELADLMIDKRKELEEKLMKLAQKARAASIHLIVATQRPSVDVITGTIKTNFTSRIAFALTNFADSKTIIDTGGAEKLLGKGDMLFKPSGRPEPVRVQGAFVSSEEVKAVVDYVKKHNEAVFDANLEKEMFVKREEISSTITGDFDPLLKQVIKFFIESKTCSTTMIQRRFGVGFMRAGRIMDQLEYHKFISVQEGTKPRQVLITIEEFNNIFPD